MKALILFRGPLFAAALVALAGAFALPSLRDAATHQTLPAATLHHPFGYLLGAPLYGLWDTLTLLAVSQHYAAIATLIVLYPALRLVAATRSRRNRPVRAATQPPGAATRPNRTPLSGLLRRLAREVLLAAGALAALLAFYAAAALIPRPMAAIRLTDPDLLAVDFHSHTNHSHDGWSRFTAAHNRAWHEGGGFDAAYITDHYTWAGVDDALGANPRLAGERTVLLSGMEVRMRGRHVNILGERERYLFALDSTSHHLDPDPVAEASARGGPMPTILYTIPGPLDQVAVQTRGADGRVERAGVIGIELSDGAPRGLEQVRRERAKILALADSLDLAVVAGTNHHGWGRTAPAWSVMRIPGWREMSPDELGRAIEETLHRERRRAVTVVERRVPWHDGSAIAVAATVPWLLWEQLRMLTPRERVGWLGWAGVWVVVRALRVRRRGSSSAGPPPDGSETAANGRASDSESPRHSLSSRV